MNKNKFNLRNVVAIAICLVGLMAFVGCEKDDHNPLVGKWVTAGNDHNHIEDGGFILFTDCMGFVATDFFATIGTVSVTYSVSGNRITIIFHDNTFGERGSHTFEYVLNDNLLTIKNFSGFLSMSQQEEITDVHFTRVQ